MIVVPDISSDDDDNNDTNECECSTCATTNEDHFHNRQSWDDLSHIIKCVYRATENELTGLLFQKKFLFKYHLKWIVFGFSISSFRKSFYR